MPVNSLMGGSLQIRYSDELLLGEAQKDTHGNYALDDWINLITSFYGTYPVVGLWLSFRIIEVNN